MSKIMVTGAYGLVGSQFKGDEYERFGSGDLNLINQKYHGGCWNSKIP